MIGPKWLTLHIPSPPPFRGPKHAISRKIPINGISEYMEDLCDNELMMV